MNQADNGMPIQYMVIEPYVYHTLRSIVGTEVVIETTRGSIRGNLKDVKPDHVVLAAGDSSFFIRTAEVIWVMPDND